MKLKVLDIDVATGFPLIAIINESDARKLDLHYDDRVKIKKGSKSAVALINISESSKTVPPGRIGFCEEVLEKLNSKSGDIVDVSLARKPYSVNHIKKKLKGGRLNYDEMLEIVEDIIKNKLSSVEITYFVSACYLNELDIKETIALTKAMINTGQTLKFRSYPVADKHCIGGVAGNRTTPIVVPIIAAAGITVPKTSSRSITSPAGTADTMEVLCDVSFPIKKMKSIIKKTKACLVWGGSVNLAPADDKIIKIEHPVSLDPEGQLLASILAKKKSVSATHLLIDIPVGKGAKIESIAKAIRLKRLFEKISKHLNIKVKVMITDGSQPIGNGIGPALEARDILFVLRNDPRQPLDLRKKSVEMAGIILEMSGKAKKGSGRKKALEILNSGKAYSKMLEILKAQKAKITDPDDISVSALTYDLTAEKDSSIKSISNSLISRAARAAGAPLDKGAGIYLHKKVGNRVKKGEPILTVFSGNIGKLKYAAETLKKYPAVCLR